MNSYNEQRGYDYEAQHPSLANCYSVHVARTLAEVEDAELRSLVWFAQGIAMKLGGFHKLAERIVTMLPEFRDPKAVRDLGPNPPEILDHETAEKVTYEINGRRFVNYVDGEIVEKDGWELITTLSAARESYERKSESERNLREFTILPRLNQHADLFGSRITDVLRRFREVWIAQTHAQLADTRISREVFEALEYAKQTGPRITLIEGDPRTGKSISAETWVAAHVGRARYLTLESTMSDTAFYVEVNRAIGNAKAQVGIATRLRSFIREVLDTKDLLLVIDEAQWMWSHSRKAVPSKINWLMTGLVNRGCSVALIVTPQFLADLGRFENETRWAAAQWKGRIVNYVRLPSTIDAAEVQAVASSVFPEGDATAIRTLAAFAKASPSYLQAIRVAANRARYFASKEGVSVTRDHIRRATSEQLALAQDLAKASATRKPKSPADRSKVSAIEAAQPAPVARHQPAAASRLHQPCNTLSNRLQDVPEAALSVT